MTSEELSKILSSHALWLKNPDEGERAGLAKADLRKADLNGADLRKANLRGADLRGADLSGADLKGADLAKADARGIVSRAADLSEVRLAYACRRGFGQRNNQIRLNSQKEAFMSVKSDLRWMRLNDWFKHKRKISLRPSERDREAGLRMLEAARIEPHHRAGLAENYPRANQARPAEPKEKP